MTKLAGIALPQLDPALGRGSENVTIKIEDKSA
jgi:hypothetical protein